MNYHFARLTLDVSYLDVGDFALNGNRADQHNQQCAIIHHIPRVMAHILHLLNTLQA